MNIPFGPPGPSRTAVPRSGGGGLVSQILAGRRAGPMRPIPRAQAGAGASGGVAWGGQVFHSPEDLVNFINGHGGNTTVARFLANHAGAAARFGQRQVQPGAGAGGIDAVLDGGGQLGGLGGLPGPPTPEGPPGPPGLLGPPVEVPPDGSEFGQQASPFPLPHPVVGGAAAHVGQILGGGNQSALQAIARGRQVAQAMQHLHRLVNHPALRHVRPIR